MGYRLYNGDGGSSLMRIYLYKNRYKYCHSKVYIVYSVVCKMLNLKNTRYLGQ